MDCDGSRWSKADGTPEEEIVLKRIWKVLVWPKRKQWFGIIGRRKLMGLSKDSHVKCPLKWWLHVCGTHWVCNKAESHHTSLTWLHISSSWLILSFKWCFCRRKKCNKAPEMKKKTTYQSNKVKQHYWNHNSTASNSCICCLSRFTIFYVCNENVCNLHESSTEETNIWFKKQTVSHVFSDNHNWLLLCTNAIEFNEVVVLQFSTINHKNVNASQPYSVVVKY